jgi:hypothetical protein
MSTNSYLLCRRGFSIGYWSIIMIAAILFFAQLLPQFIAAGYKEAVQLMGTTSTLVMWAFPLLQFLLAAGVALIMSAPRSAKVHPWGVAYLIFTAFAFLWPSVVYVLNLSNTWLASGMGGFGYPTIVPCIQTWLFSGMVFQLCTWRQAESAQFREMSSQGGNLQDEWEKPVSGLRFVLWTGGLFLTGWLVLYYLPILIPKLSIYYVRFFRVLMILPQFGTFFLMLLLGVFAGRAYPINRLLKGLLSEQDSEESSTMSAMVANREGSYAPIAWGLFGLVVFSIGSYLGSQRLLAPKYAAKQ